MTLEKEFPGLFTRSELIKVGGFSLEDATYMQLSRDGKIGIYEPLDKQDSESETRYVLRNVLDEKRKIIFN